MHETAAPDGATAAAGVPDKRADVVSVRDLVKRFRRADGTIVDAVSSTTLTVGQGEFVVLLGPSGCGKTTLLRCVAGLERPDSGEIRISGRLVYSSTERVDVAPERRGLAMIFQSYALWPHMTAARNVAYPLQSLRPRLSKDEIDRRVREMLALVGIPQLERQFPNQMSGGQQQRVALARALVANRDLVLFDEPLSNVDARVREQLRIEMLAMQRDLGFAALYVTHDQAEAMQLAHRIAVISSGRVEQLGSPKQIYDEPASRLVADFIGTSNDLAGVVENVTDGVVSLATDHGTVRGVAVPGAALSVGHDAVAAWRPERCVIELAERAAPAGENESVLAGTLVAALFVGAYTEHVVAVGDDMFRHWTSGPSPLDAGDAVVLRVPSAGTRIFTPVD